MPRTRGFLFLTLAATSIVVAIPAIVAGPHGPRGVALAGSPAPPAVADAPTISSLAPMRDGFKWGITHVDVIDAFNKQGGIIDQDYDPLLRRAQPGIQQTTLEADRDNKKAAIERS